MSSQLEGEGHVGKGLAKLSKLASLIDNARGEQSRTTTA